MAEKKAPNEERFPYEAKNFIGNRLREIRLHFGFTQEDIAKTLNVTRSAYSYYELGTSRPDPAALGRLAEYYNLPVTVFYTDELPLEVILHDSDGRRRRTSRVGTIDPRKVGDLRPAERSLILLLRASDTYTAAMVTEMVKELEKRRQQQQQQEQ